MWPASMLAKSRTLCEIGREKNDSSSMTTMSGIINIGTPDGRNSLSKCKPCLQKP